MCGRGWFQAEGKTFSRWKPVSHLQTANSLLNAERNIVEPSGRSLTQQQAQQTDLSSVGKAI
jgi:hypothetical protein